MYVPRHLRPPCILALEDGRIFRGRSIGASGERAGEVIFNTGMTGYQEILTDPSYKGQIVTMTYPLMGNYGTNGEDLESGGFGMRGVEGKLVAVQWARENRVPFLGICLGMQCAVIEFARNVLGLEGANSSEFDPETPHPVIALLDEQRVVTKMGGTMCLGAYPCQLEPGSRVREAYGKDLVHERHRHRYEFNNAYREQFESAGMRFPGLSPDGGLVEMIELADHPWFVATQAHPEFKSRPTDAHSLFFAFVEAAVGRSSRG